MESWEGRGSEEREIIKRLQGLDRSIFALKLYIQ